MRVAKIILHLALLGGTPSTAASIAVRRPAFKIQASRTLGRSQDRASDQTSPPQAQIRGVDGWVPTIWQAHCLVIWSNVAKAKIYY